MDNNLKVGAVVFDGPLSSFVESLRAIVFSALKWEENGPVVLVASPSILEWVMNSPLEELFIDYFETKPQEFGTPIQPEEGVLDEKWEQITEGLHGQFVSERGLYR